MKPGRQGLKVLLPKGARDMMESEEESNDTVTSDTDCKEKIPEAVTAPSSVSDLNVFKSPLRPALPSPARSSSLPMGVETSPAHTITSPYSSPRYGYITGHCYRF